MSSLCQAEKGTLSPLECLSFANTIQADLPTCASSINLQHISEEFDAYYLVGVIITDLEKPDVRFQNVNIRKLWSYEFWSFKFIKSKILGKSKFF